ncbi:MAG TPA: hypothetical protein VED16_05270 [Candidatus Acidoferrum sp.]|nr:hypothetical protein [Candidatus Acidoferrum sp.]
MAKDFPVVLNVPKTFEVISSIIDCTLNINFKSAAFEWLKTLLSNASLENTVVLKVKEAAEGLFSSLIMAHFEGDALA